MKTIQVFSRKAQGFKPTSLNAKIAYGAYHPLNSFQTDGYKKCNAVKYCNLRMPTGCGKSWLIKALIYRSLKNDPLMRAIIVVPKLDIGSGFTDPKSNKILLPDGSNMDFCPAHNLCEEVNGAIIQEVIDFLRDPFDPNFINDRCLITTHQALAAVFSKLKEDNSLQLFENCNLWIDEGHHVQLDLLEELGLELGNKMGELVSYLLNNVPSTNVNFATATFWRGDRKRIIPASFKNVFTNYTVPIDQYLDYVGISIVYNYLVSDEPYETIVGQLCRENFCKTIFYLPRVNSIYEKHDKYEQVNKIITVIKSIYPNAIIVDLVNENGRKQEKNKVKNADYIIALEMFKEGSDYPPLARAVLLGRLPKVGESLQITGRLTRKFDGKNLIEMNMVLPFNLNQLDKEKYQDELNDWQNCLLVSQLMDDFINPIELTIPKNKEETDGEKTKKIGYLREVCADDNTYQQFMDEITERAVMLADSLKSEPQPVESFKNKLPELVEEILKEMDIVADTSLVSRYLFKMWNRHTFQMKGIDVSILDLELVDEKVHPLSWMLFGTTEIGAKTFKEIYDRIKRIYLPFEQARLFIKKLGFNSQAEWIDYCKSGNKPDYIPYHPDRVYNAFIDLADWLGSITMRKHGNFIPWEEFKIHAKSLGLTSHVEWQKYSSSGKRPNNVPGDPKKVYDEFTNWADVLGIAPQKCQIKFLPFEEAKAYINGKFKSYNEFRIWAASGQRQNDFPSTPQMTYKNKGWKGWGDFLGTNTISSQDIAKKFPPYKEAKIIVSGKFFGKEDYQKNKPENLPYQPNRTYKDTWTGWKDFLNPLIKQKSIIKCSTNGCDRLAESNGLCGAHYRRSRLGLDMNQPVQFRYKQNDGCEIDGCDKTPIAKNLCRTHYNQMRKNHGL